MTMKKILICIALILGLTSCTNKKNNYDLDYINLKSINMKKIESTVGNKELLGILYTLKIGEYKFPENLVVEIQISFPEEQVKYFGTDKNKTKISNNILSYDIILISTNLVETKSIEDNIDDLIQKTIEINVELIIDGKTVDSEIISINKSP